MTSPEIPDAAENTDIELWRETEGDAYADSIHVTKGGGIGINCGGLVYVKPIREWHRLASLQPPGEIPDAAVEALLPCPFCGGEAERVDIEDGDNAGGSCVCCKQCLASSNVEFGFKENFVSNWNRRAALPHLTAGRATAAPSDAAQIKHMVERFLRWKLPEHFRPDAGVEFHPSEQQKAGVHQWPVGTNLFDANQATEMVRFIVEGLPGSALVSAPAAPSAFPASEFAHTAALLRSGDEAVVKATLSNNFNIILAALDRTAPAAEPEPVANRAELIESLSNWLDPEIGFPNDDLLLRIHLDIELRGRKDPAFAVSVHHRNIALSAVAAALRASHLSWHDWLNISEHESDAAKAETAGTSVLTIASEALSEAVAALKACVDRMTDDHPGSNEYWQAVELAEAVIAKSEGR